VRITTRPKRALPTIVELSDRDAPLMGRVMTDELELVHKDDLEDRHGMLSLPTMDAIGLALRHVLALR
jgi:mRNA-degrading endonuclease toxin of MazEF toxin-antitoxin module